MLNLYEVVYPQNAYICLKSILYNMKSKSILFFTIVLVLGLISSSVFTSCKKEESIDAIIIVKLISDTTQRVANAHVVLSQGDVEVMGYSDQNGEFRHTFDLPIILDVTVTKDSLKGLSTIALSDPGRNVSKIVYLY